MDRILRAGGANPGNGAYQPLSDTLLADDDAAAPNASPQNSPRESRESSSAMSSPQKNREEANKAADMQRTIKAGIKYYYSREASPDHHKGEEDDDSDPFIEKFIVHLGDIIDDKVQREVAAAIAKLGGNRFDSLGAPPADGSSVGGGGAVVYTSGQPRPDNPSNVAVAVPGKYDNDDDSSDSEDLDAAKKLGPVKLTDHSVFQFVTLSVIFANTMTIALEAHYIADPEKQAFFRKLEFWFCVAYIVELVLRWRDWGFHEFFWGHNCAWNWFDFLVTVLGAVTILMATFFGSEFSGGSVIRIFRMLRMLRIFRAMKFIKDIEEVIAHAFKATMKLFFIAFIVVFIFGIMFCNLLWDTGDPTIAATFGNLELSMWSMFRLMTMDNWVVLIEPTLKYNPNFLILFIFYIFLASIALMSLVPAIFVEQSMNARECAKEEKDRKATKAKNKHDQAMLHELFRLADTDGSGKASLEELKKVVFDHRAMKKLQTEGYTNEGDVEDVTLGLFDLLEQLIEENQDHITIQLTEKQFLDGVFKQRDDDSKAASWRATTAIRMQVYRFTTKLRKDMNTTDSKLDGLRDIVMAYLTGAPSASPAGSPRGGNAGDLRAVWDAGSRGGADDACCGADMKKSPRACGSGIFG